MAGAGKHGYIVLDTETTGLPSHCFIVVQLYYKRISAGGEVLNVQDLMLAIDADDYPDHPGVAMHPKAIETHKICESTRLAGVDPKAALLDFLKDLYECIRDGGVVVGHNVQFDIRCLRNTIELLWPGAAAVGMLKVPCMCTQVMSTGRCRFQKIQPGQVCDVPHGSLKTWGGMQFEELIEPMTKYSKLVETAAQFDVECPQGKGAHDAAWDTELTDLCYNELRADTAQCAISYSCVIPFVGIDGVTGLGGIPSTEDMREKFDSEIEIVESDLKLKYEDEGTNFASIEQGTEAWYKCRRAVTASQVGALLGHSKYETPYEAAIGKIQPSTSKSRALNFGNFFEDLAQHLYVRHMRTKNHSVDVRNIGLEVCPKPYNYISVSPDGIIDLQTTADAPVQHGILEIKTAQHSKPLMIPAQSEISILQKNNYYDQVQLEMHFLSQKYGWEDTFCDFVFFNVDAVDDDMSLVSDTVSIHLLRQKCLEMGLESETEIIFGASIVAHYDESKDCFVLPYTSHLGANSPTYPLVVGIGLQPPQIYVLASAAIPPRFNTSILAYELPSGAGASADEVRAALKGLQPLTPQNSFSIFDSKKLSKSFVQQIADANGMQYNKKTKKELILAELRRFCRGKPSTLIIPHVTSKAWISISTFSYNRKYCEHLMIPSISRMFSQYKSALASFKQEATCESDPPCRRPSIADEMPPTTSCPVGDEVGEK